MRESAAAYRFKSSPRSTEDTQQDGTSGPNLDLLKVLQGVIDLDEADCVLSAASHQNIKRADLGIKWISNRVNSSDFG